jgi:cell division protein FtsB
MRISLRKLVFGCVLVAGVTYGITLVRSAHSIAMFQEKRKQIDQLERENEQLHKDIAGKQKHLDDLADPQMMKLEIEKKLKLAEPGSKQFILQDGTPSDGAGAGTSADRSAR